MMCDEGFLSIQVLYLDCILELSVDALPDQEDHLCEVAHDGMVFKGHSGNFDIVVHTDSHTGNPTHYNVRKACPIETIH